MKLNSHLNSVNEGYFQHMRHALSFTFEMLVGAVCCFIHAIFPFLCEKSGSQIVNKLHDRMVLNRASLSNSDSSVQSQNNSELA